MKHIVSASKFVLSTSFFELRVLASHSNVHFL